jgi:hypothetical protein
VAFRSWHSHRYRQYIFRRLPARPINTSLHKSPIITDFAFPIIMMTDHWPSQVKVPVAPKSIDYLAVALESSGASNRSKARSAIGA